jgi:hypothetical protein
LSEISTTTDVRKTVFIQDRARLRAGDGDLVVSCSPSVDGYEDYCREFLELGTPDWIRPAALKNPLLIAQACWEDRHVRRELKRRFRSNELQYFHPHMGTFAVWELAALVHEFSRCPVHVIAPPPAITAWANDKIAFADTVSRLLGPQYVPETTSAASLSKLARVVEEFAQRSKVIGLKLPNSSSGDSNLVLESSRYRERSLDSISRELKQLLQTVRWDGDKSVLIGRWETDVLCTPSAQLWIPPIADGPPVVEGLFVQEIEGPKATFVGAVAADLPTSLNEEIASRSWLIGYLFQRLGYVGRCSFDTILVGSDVNDCRLEFVECNGRWGGTSLPMTLMNRLTGDWMNQPYVTRTVYCPNLDRLTFAELLDELGEDLYRRATAEGRLILFAPGRLSSQSGLSVIGLGKTHQHAVRYVQEELPRRLAEIVSQRSGQ